MKQYLFYIAVTGILFTSCGNEKSMSKGGGAIVLGDSSTIVTETDSQYLKDDIPDYQPDPVETPPAKEEVVTKTEAPAEKPQEAPQPKATATASGYSINFGAIKIVFEGISANDAARQNAEKQEGLSYVVKSGKLANSRIYVYGARDVAIKQRYQSRLTLNSRSGTVDLRNLGLYTSGWKNNNDSKNGAAFVFSLNDLNKPSFSNVNNAKIKNALDRELRKRRTNSKTIQNWMKEISKTRDAGDEPCDIVLDNLQLQISGTGIDGKTFRKNIRMSV